MIPQTLLLILDGYGLAEESSINAASLAQTPYLDRLFLKKEMAHLNASGESVGLPKGFIGNSEVGHLNIGAGRIVLQDMQSINALITSGTFFHHPTFLNMCAKIKKVKEKKEKTGGRLHIMGLLSDGGVHSHIDHVIALIRLAHKQEVPVYLHAFMDGRDTSPQSGVEYIKQILPVLVECGGRLASICGRFYAMDRDKRWERVEKAWKLFVLGECEEQNIIEQEKVIEVLHSSYAKGLTDEFIEPHLVLEPINFSHPQQIPSRGEEAIIQDGDGLFFFNFRADRARQLAHAFLDNRDEPTNFAFDRVRVPKLATIASMTQYESDLDLPIIFQKDPLENTLGAYLASKNYTQLRIAETEKYAHVTYFFNGGREEAFKKEARELILSPKDVVTYDLKPEMSAFEVTEKLCKFIELQKYDFIVCNLANPDMVGHTGNLDAAIKACEVVDACVAQIEKTMQKVGGILCVTADHGNVEEMQDAKGNMQTAHSMNKTPLLIEKFDRNGNTFISLQKEGKLADIAPTLLSLWGLPIPSEMNGTVLLCEV